MLLTPLGGLTGLLRPLLACSSTLRPAHKICPKLKSPSAISVQRFTSVTHRLREQSPLISHLGPSPGLVLRHYSLLLQQTQGVVRPTLLSASPSVGQQVRTYKVRVVLKRRCKGCYFEKREGRWFVECTLKPRHKQMQKMSPKNVYKDDYSKGNIFLAAHWGWRKRRFYWEGDNTPKNLYKPLIDYTNTRVNSPT